MKDISKPIKIPSQKLNFTRWTELIKFLEEQKGFACADLTYVDKMFYSNEISLSEYGKLKFFIHRRIDIIQGIFDILKNKH